MKYLGSAYYDEKKFDTLSKTELQAIVSECPPHDEALRESGHLLAVASLQHRTATTLRPSNGKTTLIDGPFAETKEQIGAFFIIEAKDRNEAIRVASKHPAAPLGERVGWAVEVRPIAMFEQPRERY
ncbi:MAG: YciI family protein [Candidatus Tectomicrobia bacterium]|nr:YciI family protein [Candidatus Tectomicrobia bacterium]